MKENTFYFPHDYNAREDEKIIRLIQNQGWEGYGLYWGLVEKLYEAGGKLSIDLTLLSFYFRVPEKTIEKIINSYALFYRKHNCFGSRSVDRRLDERKAKSEKARASANAKRTLSERKRILSDSSARKERKVKERNNVVVIDNSVTDTKGVKTVHKSVDISEDPNVCRMPWGEYRGVHVIGIPVETCRWYLKEKSQHLKIHPGLTEALEARVKIKESESIK